MKLSELFNKPFRLKGGSILNLRGFSKRVIDREISGGESDISGEYKDEECLGFTAVDGDVTVSLQNNYGNAPVVYYKREGQDWTLWDYSGLNITDGETVRFYGENNYRFSRSNQKYSNFVMSGSGTVKASGECNSLLNKEKTKVIQAYSFYKLFYNCTLLTTAPNLSAISFGSYAYSYMFSGCRNLFVAPALPAIDLDEHCYDNMFAWCTNLIDAPELPAINLANFCYSNMFSNCTKLKNAPELPAINLADYCYSNMFQYCRGLQNAPELPATTLARLCYNTMFGYCTSLITAPRLPATILANGCYGNMFNGCTSLINAPKLSVVTLAENCYQNMFSGCTALTTAPELPATTLVSGCYSGMFNYCSKLNYVKALFTTIPSSSYTDSWLSGVAATGTFVKNSQATWDVSGPNGIPTGWTVETADN